MHARVAKVTLTRVATFTVLLRGAWVPLVLNTNVQFFMACVRPKANAT